MLTMTVCAAWQRAQRRDDRARSSGWSPLLARDGATSGQWGRALAYEHERRCHWAESLPLGLQAGFGWERADALRLLSASGWSDLSVRDFASRLGWNRSIAPREIRLALVYNPTPGRIDVSASVRARRVNEHGPRHDPATTLQASLYVPGSGALAFAFGGQPYFPGTQRHVFFDFRYVPLTPAIQPTDLPASAVGWQNAHRLSLQTRLPWGRAQVVNGVLTDMPYVDYPGTVKPLPVPPPDPEILDTYMIANTVNLVVLPSRTPIEAKSVRIGLDADSFSWKFSADIFTHAALDLVRPDAEGAKEVELDINGWKWVLLIERYSRQLKFPAEAYSISGATRSQLLAAPYAPLRTGLNSAPITARQAATAELKFTGFTLNWDAENIGPADWTFPAGTLSYQGQTAMQVIARIAETEAAVVRPGRETDAIEIRPRYSVPPWEWANVDAPIDRIIPPAMMTELNGEWTPQPAWNACYVSGTSAGVSMLVRRAGTAGDNPTSDVFDDWLTGEEANRARGIHELSKGGNVEIVGFTLPLFPVSDDKGVGLVLPTMLCRVPEETGAWYGVCLAVDISASGTGSSRVQQQLKLERHH